MFVVHSDSRLDLQCVVQVSVSPSLEEVDVIRRVRMHHEMRQLWSQPWSEHMICLGMSWIVKDTAHRDHDAVVSEALLLTRQPLYHQPCYKTAYLNLVARRACIHHDSIIMTKYSHRHAPRLARTSTHLGLYDDGHRHNHLVRRATSARVLDTR